ncbi:hypothetical protein CP533_2448 [Ophiocordyceps camponoti-saundersi (nom. inval.)]|nr:hypothetical protein CP533_2448 [Ophiocordyceps camponoti-saundersi (nom. inval.)]
MNSSSTSASGSPVNVLEYLRLKSSIDYDSLDMRVVTELGPFVDCTSNQARSLCHGQQGCLADSKQWESYTQLRDPGNASLVEESSELARRLQPDMTDISVEELAVEIASMGRFM